MAIGAAAGRREWVGLAVIALPCLLYAMDLTVLNLAIPQISAALKPTSAQLLWIVDIYGFLVAGLLITMGNLGDRFGRRKVLLLGAAAFGLASVFAAFATSDTMLIVARAVLGVAGATVAPSTLSLIRTMFVDPRQRTFAIGVWVTSFSLGGAIGPLLGGVLLELFWWGSVFLLAIPVMALVLVLGPLLLPEYRDPAPGPLDLLSVGLSIVAVLMVIFGLKLLAQDGASLLPLASALLGLILGIAFIRRQRRLADPLVDLQLFHAPAFSAALASYTLAAFVSFGSFIGIAQYLQLVLGLSPFVAGLWTIPSSIAFVVGSLLTPLLVRWLPPGAVMTGGLIGAAVGFVMLLRIDAASALAIIVAGTVLFSLALAPVFTLATDIIVGSAPPERAGAAAAISETGAELGGALGIAILGSFGVAIYRGRLGDAMPAGIGPPDAAAARDSLGGAFATAQALPPDLQAALLASAREAFTNSLQLTSGIAAAIALAAAVLTVMMLRR